MQVKIENKDYFSIKSISNSSLSYIDPNIGGSPVAFKNFFEDKIEEEKKYFKMGHLIHKWAEDRNAFCISSVNKPSDKLGDVADCALAIIEDEKKKWESEVTKGMSYKPEYDDIIVEACQVVAWNPRYGRDALIKNAVPPIKPYLEEVLTAENNNQIYVSLKESEVISNCVKAVENHPVAKDLLFMQDTDFSNKKVFSELEIYWTKAFEYRFAPTLEFPDGEVVIINLTFKAKLDKLVIDFDNKVITYTDPKTTSGGAYGFSESFEKYKYYRQQAFYNWAIREFCKQQGFDITYFEFKNYNIAIETNGLFQVVVYNIPPRWIDRGKTEYQNLIKKIVEHEATNQWNYSLEEVKGNLVMELPFKEN